MSVNNRLTITDVANSLGITPRTIMRWEKAGKIKKSKRDWRGWRFYTKEDASEIKKFFESTYEYDEDNRQVTDFVKVVSAVVLSIGFSLFACAGYLHAQTAPAKTPGVVETPSSVDISLNSLPVIKSAAPAKAEDAITYTLGPDDIISIEVRRHPIFSGQHTINSEGMIEYKHVGDIYISGMTKAQVKDKLYEILSEYLIEPEIDVTIVAYLSKVFYVVGEVGRPGKFYMKGNTITAREALFQAGLPTHAAAMRRCRLITPEISGKENYVDIDVYRLLYAGDLTQNLEIKPNEVLYVPATFMAKAIRIISPATEAAGRTAGAVAVGATTGL